MIMTNKLSSEGSAFEALSRNVRDVTIDSNARVQDMVKIIKSIIDASENVSAIFNGPARDDQIKGSFGMSMDDCINHISAALDRYKENCVKTAVLAQNMVKAIGRAKQRLDFFPKWINECERVLESVELLLDKLSPWHELTMNLPPDVRDDIVKRYTIETERCVHQSLVPNDDIFKNMLSSRMKAAKEAIWTIILNFFDTKF